METSLSNLDLTEVESASPSSPPPPAANETQDPSDQERHLASKASLAYFTKKNNFEALAWLENLSVLRPTDPRVSGNLAVVSFLTSGGGFNELGKLQSDLKNTYINIISGAGGEFEESELPVLIYNIALAAYLQKQFLIAEKLLEQIHSSLTSSSSHNCLAFKFRHLLPLLISVSLCLNKPTQALMYLNEADIMSRQLDEDNTFSSRSILFRAHALVLSKQHKTFKRDLKPTGLSPEQMTTYEFFRANLEYLKGNHRKAVKLLALAMQQQPADKIGTRFESMYENNLGCLHLMLGKPNLSVFYFGKALQQHSTHFAELRRDKAIRKDAALYVKQTEIVYNLGLALLHAGQPEKAFQNLTNCLPALEMNPSLWLHLAECCIAACKQSFSHDVKHLYGKSNTNNNDQSKNSPTKTVIGTIGSGIHRKFVLKPTSSKHSASAINPSISLEYASQCLRNALALCGHPVFGEKPQVSSPKGNGNTSSANSSAQTSPVKSVSNVSKTFLLRATILVDSAYVALCLSNPVSALDFSQRLLEFNKNGILPNGYKMLAHLYAAEALIQLSRISEATDHLDPSNIQDISFSDLTDSASDETNQGSKSSDSTSAARIIFQFNLIVAFALRGELDKAETLLEKLWSEDRDQDRFGIGLQMLTLRMYIQLAKGNVERCRELAIKHCSIIQQK